jgi:hypothetical protein
MIEHMFDASWLADLDAEAAAELVGATQDALREQEWREITLAAQWAVLHDEHTVPPVTGPRPRGIERAVSAGGDGTPRIAEFACAELGALMGTGFIAAANLIRDAVDLQHRHPLLWAALGEGRGRVWKARRVAAMVHAAGLTREQAWLVDAATTGYVDTLTWSAFTRLVEAKIIEADPAAAEARRVAAELERFVATGQSSEHGLKTLVARANAGEVIYFVAMCDRIAQILALQGDPDPVGARRSKALGILANPAHALTLLEDYASDDPHPDDPDPDPDDDEGDTGRAGGPDGPGQAAASTEAPTAAPGGCPTCGGSPFKIDPARLRPRAVLHVRISEQVLRAGTGVAYVEHDGGIVVPAGALRDLLGHHHVTVRPVLDLRDQVPVDAYEVPTAMREALRLARPSSVFPWTRVGTGTPDMDHNRPYLPMDRGGPPGQTRIGNLGPLHRFGHRVKTHGRGWVLRQPRPGLYLFRTPQRYWFRVDNDGTHPLGKDADLTAHLPPRPRTPLEVHFARVINSHAT